MPEAPAPVHGTVRDAVAGATAALAAAGCETPRLDAELLLGSVIDVDRTRLLLEPGRRLEPSVQERFHVLVARREAREPVAYILGIKEFRRIAVAVDRRVLIPRPETELLVEAALELPAGTALLDVGCGSGAVALAVKDERPDLDVRGADVDADAVAVARANAARLRLDVPFVTGDLLAGLECDAVLANLPYVAQGASLPPEIARFEPPGALCAGSDGLDLIRRLVACLGGVPFVVLEIGFDQADAATALLADAGYARIERRRDLAGHDRVVVARR